MRHGHTRTPEEHLDAVRDLFPPRRIVELPASETLGLRLARDVAALEDAPRFDNSQMDGYALGEAHLAGGSFPVGPTIAAGADPATILPEGISGREVHGVSVPGEEVHPEVTEVPEAPAHAMSLVAAAVPGGPTSSVSPVIPVMTGAKLPLGTAAIVPVEWCRPREFGAEQVEIPPTPAGQFIRVRGSDITTGSRLVEAGRVVNASTIGVAAAQGLTHLPVYEPAKVLICTGGDELGEGEATLRGAAMIRDANGPMLAALCAHHRINVVGHVRTTDDPLTFGALLRAAVERTRPTAVITSGGISHGRFEVVRQLFEGGDDAIPWFGHVAQQPGGPQGLASITGVPVVCLPGNPVSTMVSFRLFIAPVLGIAEEPVTAVLDAPVAGQESKDCFHRARRRTVDGQVVVTPVGGAGSHLLAQSVDADCLLRIPAASTPQPGELVSVYPL